MHLPKLDGENAIYTSALYPLYWVFFLLKVYQLQINSVQTSKFKRRGRVEGQGVLGTLRCRAQNRTASRVGSLGCSYSFVGLASLIPKALERLRTAQRAHTRNPNLPKTKKRCMMTNLLMTAESTMPSGPVTRARSTSKPFTANYGVK